MLRRELLKMFALVPFLGILGPKPKVKRHKVAVHPVFKYENEADYWAANHDKTTNKFLVDDAPTKDERLYGVVTNRNSGYIEIKGIGPCYIGSMHTADLSNGDKICGMVGMIHSREHDLPVVRYVHHYHLWVKHQEGVEPDFTTKLMWTFYKYNHFHI